MSHLFVAKNNKFPQFHSHCNEINFDSFLETFPPLQIQNRSKAILLTVLLTVELTISRKTNSSIKYPKYADFGFGVETYIRMNSSHSEFQFHSNSLYHILLFYFFSFIPYWIVFFSVSLVWLEPKNINRILDKLIQINWPCHSFHCTTYSGRLKITADVRLFKWFNRMNEENTLTVLFMKSILHGFIRSLFWYNLNIKAIRFHLNVQYGCNGVLKPIQLVRCIQNFN